jgi:hypothetical protein
LDAGAHFAQFGGLLEHRDFEASPQQTGRRRHAADTAANNEDFRHVSIQPAKYFGG